MTLPQYNMGYNFSLVYPIATIGSILPFRHFLGITGRPPFCNDSINYTHKLCTIAYPYMPCSHPHCSGHDSGLNTLRTWSTSALPGPLLRQTLGSVTALCILLLLTMYHWHLYWCHALGYFLYGEIKIHFSTHLEG